MAFRRRMRIRRVRRVPRVRVNFRRRSGGSRRGRRRFGVSRMRSRIGQRF